jgi:hypothetical protein
MWSNFGKPQNGVDERQNEQACPATQACLQTWLPTELNSFARHDSWELTFIRLTAGCLQKTQFRRA